MVVNNFRNEETVVNCSIVRFVKRFWYLALVLSLFLILFTSNPGKADSGSEDQSTEILWDTWGVPHLFCDEVEGLFYASGYAQMKSHANLILDLYGRARGRAAEYWGDKEIFFDVQTLNSDKWVHGMRIPNRAKEWFEQQSPEIKNCLNSFVAGMNAFAKDHPGQIDDEHKVVLPVQPEDVLAHVQQAIHFTFITNMRIFRQVEEYLNNSQRGSNAWAISPKRSASGNAMLLVNPHLPWGDLFTWYEMHFKFKELNIYGAALVGTPVPVIAFNDYLGWTHTVNTHDGVDLYELELADGGYRWDGEIKQFENKETIVKVKQEDGSFKDEKIISRYSIHGPVIAVHENKAVAMRVVGLDSPHIFEQYWDMLTAKSLGEFESALKKMQLPMFTVMYADRDGHIMHFFGGLTPVRPEGDWNWRGIVPGNTSKTLWTECHPYEDLPKIVDPSSGWLQNANDPPWTTTFPQAIDPDDYPKYMAPRGMSFRPQRSARMLDDDESITFDEMIEYKHSTRMELADRILDDLFDAVSENLNETAKKAVSVLKEWDRSADVDSRGAVLFAQFAQELEQMVEFPFAEHWKPDSPRTTPDGLANPKKAVEALAKSADFVQEKYGALDVSWGKIHRLRKGDVNLPANGGPSSLGIFRAARFSPMQNNKYIATSGDSYVAAVEFTNPIRAKALTVYGNSSQPGSPHRTDQMEFFSKKKLRSVWLTREDIESNLESRKVLNLID